MVSEDVQKLEGVLSSSKKEVTLRILVARSINKFTKCAINRAKIAKESAGYNIILTDENDLYSDLIEFIESHPLDGSNSIILRNRELQLVRTELVEAQNETQQLRVEHAQDRQQLIEFQQKFSSYIFSFAFFFGSFVVLNTSMFLYIIFYK